MKAIVKAYAPLLKQAYYANRTGSVWMTLFLLALGVTAFLLWGLALGAWRTGVNIVCGMLAIVIFIWWGAFVRNAIQQNSPANASLTPHLRRRLITLTALLSALCVLSMAALAATAMGHFAYWLVGVAFVFPYMLASARYPTFSFLPFVLIFSSASVFERPIKQAVNLVTAYGDLPFAVVGLLLIVAANAWLLPRAFPAGGDRHIAWVRSSADTLARLKLAGTTSAGADGAQPLWRPGRGAYAAALRRASSRKSPPMSMLMYALGPLAHPASIKSSAGVLLVLGGFVLADRMSWMQHATFLLMCWLLQLYVSLPAMIYFSSVNVAVSRTSAEQGLLRLAPGIPRSSEFNRALARKLMSQFLRVWAVGVFSAVCIGWVATESLAVSAAVVMLMASTLGASALLLTDYASMRLSGSYGTSLARILWLVMVLVLVIAAHVAPAGLWFGAALVVLLAGVALIAVRWKWMMTLPPAFPAGRMGV